MFTSQESKLNPLDLADRDLVFGAVVKFGGSGRLMRSHLLGMLEPALHEGVPRVMDRHSPALLTRGEISHIRIWSAG